MDLDFEQLAKIWESATPEQRLELQRDKMREKLTLTVAYTARQIYVLSLVDIPRYTQMMSESLDRLNAKAKEIVERGQTEFSDEILNELQAAILG